MVKKLFKHEFAAWLRIIVFFWGAALLTAAFNRVLQVFESDNVSYDMLMSSGVTLYVIAVLCCMAFPTIFGIVRLYRNFFTGEGYLTFTLPATKAQLLWVKVSTAVCFSALSAVVCLLSGCIIMAGEVFLEVCKAFAYIFKDIPGDVAGHLITWLLELLLCMLMATVGNHLFLYTCVCLGQLFRKNRILAAVGVYFGFYLLSQVLSTIFSITLVMQIELGWLDSLEKFVGAHPLASLHILLLGSAALNAAIGAVYWLICHWVLRKKLNLE